MAVKLRASRSRALARAISALVLAGLPTTSTLTLRSATSLSALPWAEKICAFASSRSLRSMPGPRGRAPTSSATWQSRKATCASSVATTLPSVGKAQSSSSITTPCSAPSAGGDLQQMQVHARVGPEQAPGGNPEGEGIADLAGSAGDRDVDGSFHGAAFVCREKSPGF